ncbi:3825_t:CDS:2, partial [Racocetra persica]
FFIRLHLVLDIGFAELKPNDELDILRKIMGQIASNLTPGKPEFRGSKEFKYVVQLREKITDKELNFIPNEKKYLVKYIDKIYDKLRAKYEEIYLVRNERFFKLHTFEDGKSFEPDYVLFLRQKMPSRSLYYQVFIEPK